MQFSFVTCTYNRAEGLSRTLQSLVVQKFSAEEFQIIIIDNNSSDNTWEVCKSFIEEYSCLQIEYYKETNQGLSYALNRGIKEAKGDYIVYVDDDETVAPDHLYRLSVHLYKYPKMELIASPVVPLYEDREPKWMSLFTQRLIGGSFNAGNKLKKLGKGKYPGTGHTVIKRELYRKFGDYNTELGRKGSGLLGAEDKDMAFRLINNNIACYYIPDIPIYHHIPKYKLTDEFFTRLTYSIGKSERIRTKAVSEGDYYKRLFDELIKWGASVLLFFFYFITLRLSKGVKLLEFRWNVSKGLLGC